MTYHEGRPIIRQHHGMTFVLCPYGHVYTAQPFKNWAGSWLEAKASDPAWTVRCEGSVPRREPVSGGQS